MKRILVLVAFSIGTVLGAEATPISIVNNLPGAFIDISGTGTNMNIEGDDISGVWNATHGNVVLAAGNINISTNSTACVPAQNTFTNQALGAASTRGYYPLWDDFRTDLGGGDIFAQNMADRTIIQWNNLRTFDTPGTDFGTWQLQIFDNGPIFAQYIYQDVVFVGNAAHDNGASATIGAVSTPDFAQWSFNLASIQNGTVLSIIPEPASLTLLALGGLALLRRR